MKKKIKKQTIGFFRKNKKRIENKSSKILGNKTSLKSTPFLINHTECNFEHGMQPQAAEALLQRHRLLYF